MLDTSTDKKGDGVRVVWMQGKNESGAAKKGQITAGRLPLGSTQAN